MKNKLKLVNAILLIAVMLYTVNSSAHSRYLLPSHTVLSGEETQFVTLSASISNDIFHHDMPLGDDGNGRVVDPLKTMFKQLNYIVTEPDGQTKQMDWYAFARHSVADLELKKSGTYKVVIEQPALLMTTFKEEDGNPGRVFGEMHIPKGATDIVKRQINGKVVSYVTYNKPNKTALTPTGNGLELSGESHPNDLFVNEEGTFRLLLNGQAASDVQIYMTKAGTKHRNQREKLGLITDKNGNFNINLSEPGFYLLEAELEMPAKLGSSIDYFTYSLYVTFEVFPE